MKVAAPSLNHSRLLARHVQIQSLARLLLNQRSVISTITYFRTFDNRIFSFAKAINGYVVQFKIFDFSINIKVKRYNFSRNAVNISETLYAKGDDVTK